jgi:hypothetical protein
MNVDGASVQEITNIEIVENSEDKFSKAVTRSL